MIRTIVGANVARLRDQRFAEERTETGRNKAMAKAMRTSLSQVQRVETARERTEFGERERQTYQVGALGGDLERRPHVVILQRTVTTSEATTEQVEFVVLTEGRGRFEWSFYRENGSERPQFSDWRAAGAAPLTPVTVRP